MRAITLRLTGALTISTQTAARRIGFSEGWPVTASSSEPGERPEARYLQMLPPEAFLRVQKRAELEKLDFGACAVALRVLRQSTVIETRIRQDLVVLSACLDCPVSETSFTPAERLVAASVLPLFGCIEDAVGRYDSALREELRRDLAGVMLELGDGMMDVVHALGPSIHAMRLLEQLSRGPMTFAKWVESTAHAPHHVGLALVLSGAVEPSGDEGSFSAAEIDAAVDAFDRPEERVIAQNAQDASAVAGTSRSGGRLRTSGAALLLFAIVSAGIWWMLQSGSASTSATPEIPTREIRSREIPSLATPPLPASAPASVPAAPPLVAAAPRARASAVMSEEARQHFDRGNGWLEKRRMSAALAAYKRAVQASPDVPQLHRALAVAYTLEGRMEEAVFEYKLYLALDPEAEDSARIREIIESVSQEGE